MSIRYDYAPIAGYEETPEGWLRVWCRAARTGVQEYRQKDGTVRREYRPPEEVGNPKSLETFGMVPVTLEHPPVLLDSKNTRDYQRGYSGSKVDFDGKFVSVALTITDSDAIDAIKSGRKKEVSAGYKVEFDAVPGVTPEGEKYDGVQRDIVANHIAVVEKGRAGSEVRLLMDRMDSEDAISTALLSNMSADRVNLNSANRSDPPMARITLDSMELEVPNEVVGPIQQFVNDSLRSQEELVSRIEELQEALEDAQTQYNELYAESESAQGKLDAMSEHIEELEQRLQEGGEFNMDAIDELIDERIALLDHLAPALDPEMDYRGLSARDLYEHAYINIFGDDRTDSETDIDLSDLDDGYLMGAVDTALASFDPSEDSEEEEFHADSQDYAGELDEAMNRRGGTTVSPISAYQQRLAAAWQQPLTAHK